MSLTAALSAENGYFRFDRDLVCYGRSCSVTPAASSDDHLSDLLDQVRTDQPDVQLPYAFTLEVIENTDRPRDDIGQFNPAGRL